jgi:hypothetical protein
MAIKISELTALSTAASADVLPIVDDDVSATKKISIANLFASAPSDSISGDAIDGGTISNANIAGSYALSGVVDATAATIEFRDDNIFLVGSADNSKKVNWQVDNLTTSTTRTLTVQDASGTLPLLDRAQTWGGLQKFDDGVQVARNGNGDLLVGTTSTTIDSSNFGINLNGGSPLGKLEASADLGGTSVAHGLFGNAGQLRIKGDGDLENTNGNYGTISDPRLKQDVTPAQSQWDDVRDLGQRFVNYRLIESVERQGDDAPTLLSVLADDDFAARFPGLTKTGDDGYRSFKQSVASMKALIALSEALNRIEALEAKID